MKKVGCPQTGSGVHHARGDSGGMSGEIEGNGKNIIVT